VPVVTGVKGHNLSGVDERRRLNTFNVKRYPWRRHAVPGASPGVLVAETSRHGKHGY